jgi:hypothetical protein
MPRPIPIDFASDEWRRFDWHRQDAARMRVEALLRLISAADANAIVVLGQAGRDGESLSLAEVRRRAWLHLFDGPDGPIIGEEIASCTLDDLVSAAAAEQGEIRGHTHGLADDPSLWDHAYRAAHDALSALIAMDAISSGDFKLLTRAWSRTLGPLAD